MRRGPQQGCCCTLKDATRPFLCSLGLDDVRERGEEAERSVVGRKNWGEGPCGDGGGFASDESRPRLYF